MDPSPELARFRTKARAVDLLGDKQIKDDTTAISELFKNAHDADASQAELAINTKAKTIVLWDDGHGMSPMEVETKWLTLGTDSKYASPGKPKLSESGTRVMMGDKGIGRLAIATLGRQMLMITKRKGETNPFVLVYIHWGVFENGSMLLEETVIPIRKLPSLDAADLPEIIEDMKRLQLRNLREDDGTRKSAWEGEYANAAESVEREIREFGIPQGLEQDPLETWLSQSSGTAFFVTHPKEDWRSFADPGRTSERLIRKRRNLSIMMSSFINTIGLFAEASTETYLEDVYPFVPRFLIDGLPVVNAETFAPEDFKQYDYGLVGRLENGRFSGQALIYGQSPADIMHDCDAGIDARDNSDCGPLDLRLYFVEGELKNSHLPKPVHTAITDKLDRIGGIYVYRDGLRVLPYGTLEFDFLEIEKRRTLNAGRYLFSMRRMFGYIAISKEHNPDLQDKSSREGLRENEQYDFFRFSLMNLLIWFALDYLNGEGRREAFKTENQEKYRQQKEEEELQEKQERERKEYIRKLRHEISEAMSEIQSRRKKVESDMNARILTPGKLGLRLMLMQKGKADTYFELFALLDELTALKSEYQHRISTIDAGIKPYFDERYAKTADVAEQRHAYEDFLNETQSDLRSLLEQRWATAREYLEGQRQQYLDQVAQQMHTVSGATFVQGLQEAVKRSAISLETSRQESSAQLNREVSERVARYTALIRDLEQTVDAHKEGVLDKWTLAVDDAFASLEQENNGIRELLGRFVSLTGTEDLRALATGIQSRLEVVAEHLEDTAAVCDGLIQQALAELAVPSLDVLDRATATLDDRKLIALLEGRLQEMNSQMEQYRSLVATGMAAEVVNHEFEQQYELIHQIFDRSVVRNVMRQVPDIATIEDLFKHIEERHRLMSPLYRRTRMYRKSLRLYDIGERMREFFQAHFRLYDIDFDNAIDPEFTVYESEPILYPVFINIINNAVYWLLSQSDRIIRLRSDIKRGYLYLEDSGPGVEPERAEKVFELFYSTRQDGRGIGLHLVRELLGSRNHLVACITANEEKTLAGACFRIQFDPSTLLPGGSIQ